VKDKRECLAKVGKLEQHSRKGWPVSVIENDAAKMSRGNSEWCEEKVVNEVLRMYPVCVK